MEFGCVILILTTVIQTLPLVVRSVLNKERERTFEKIFTLEKPSFKVTTCFEIEATYIHYNVTNTLYL
jgi:hypothetical protein